jgi:hypothetical protein
MRVLKLMFWAVLIVCVGLPAAFLLFVFTMAALGVAIGIGAAIVGMVLMVLKAALLIIVPVAVIYWIAKRLMAPERTY